MKRIYLILIMFIFTISYSFSQIQRTFLGCSLGNTKQLVLQKIKSYGYTIYKTTDGFYAESNIYHKIKFGGYYWKIMDFKFYKNLLYTVTFCSTSYSSQSKEMLLTDFKELKEKLYKKYGSKGSLFYEARDISLDDSKTGVVCRYLYLNNEGDVSYQDAYNKRLNLYLWYYDIQTNKKINKKEHDEL